MANREELAVIRGARAGLMDSQLALGRLYLFGSQGLPKSLPTALHWLDRAACQGCAEAWELIGNHIPLELARQSPQPVIGWYEKAYDGGLVRAGLVYAQLALGNGEHRASVAQRAKAMRALDAAGQAGFAEAQWLLAHEYGVPAQNGTPAMSPDASDERRAAQQWLRRAADNGVAPAQFALLEQAWADGDGVVYLQRALPLARALTQAANEHSHGSTRLAPDEVTLLSRCARLIETESVAHDATDTELHAFWELAALEQDRHAQLALGLDCARMHVDGKRKIGNGGAANFKKAVRWLNLAGEQGLAQAWYALSRIYIKPEFSQRNVLEAQRYLERAAEMGYREAQLECGNAAWRARRENEGNDVRAVFWLQKAASQGCAKADIALRKIAPRNRDAWKGLADTLAGRDLSDFPLLVARLELAMAFGLSRAEMLLLDMKSADRGHCLVIDIRASYGRSRRRLVVVETAQERQLLDRLALVFDHVDCGPGGPEGNYRQRLYRLRTLLPEADASLGEIDYDLAA